jgi:hypothetical protein
LGYLIQKYTPWWSVALLCAITSLLFRYNPGRAFGYSFIAIFVLWGGLALSYDLANETIMATRMGNLFGGIPHWGMVILTGFIGGLIAGMGGFAAASFRRAFS